MKIAKPSSLTILALIAIFIAGTWALIAHIFDSVTNLRR